MKTNDENNCNQLYDNRFCKNDNQANKFIEALDRIENRNDPEILRIMIRSLTDKNEAEEVYATLIDTICEFKATVLIKIGRAHV